MTKQFSRYCFMIVILLSFCFLSSVACTDSKDSSSRVQIIDRLESIGSDGENIENQTLSFKWQVKNNDSEEALLQWVQPNLSEELANRLLTENTKINVGKAIKPGEIIDVEGAITFDASGLSKQEIIEKCYISDVTVSIESTINISFEQY